MGMRRRDRRHALVGRVFGTSMVGSILLAVPVLIATENLFLSGLGFIAAWMLATGWRFARLRNGEANVLDRCLPLAGIAFFAAFGVWGATHIASAGPIALVPAALGGLGIWLALGQRRGFSAPQGERPWQRLHGAAIGGAWIASMTAFAAATVTNWVPSVPEWLLWVAPSAICVPLLRRRVRELSSAATSASGPPTV